MLAQSWGLLIMLNHGAGAVPYLATTPLGLRRLKRSSRHHPSCTVRKWAKIKMRADANAASLTRIFTRRIADDLPKLFLDQCSAM